MATVVSLGMCICLRPDRCQNEVGAVVAHSEAESLRPTPKDSGKWPRMLNACPTCCPAEAHE